MNARAAFGLALVGGSLAAVGVGVAAAVRAHNRSQNSAAPLGKTTRKPAPIERIPDRGMTLFHYRTSRMPIRQRISILQDMTAKSVKQASMRKLALAITRNCPARDGVCESRAIYDWIRNNIRYTGDVGPHKLSRKGPVEAVDLFQRADRTVEFGGGDCDDHNILGCTLALLNGLDCRYRATSTSAGAADDYGHIYPIIGLPKGTPRKWVAIDSTLPGSNFGVEAPHKKHLDFIA